MERAARIAGLALLLLGAGCTPTLHYAEPRLTSGANLSQGKRLPAQTFDLDDRVVMLVDVTWPDPTADGGLHDCQWRWYRGGQLVSQTPVRQIRFARTPVTLHTARPAAALGVGHYTVETLVDGAVVATSRFDIVG